MENQESTIQKLIEQYDFAELSADQTAFVLKHSSIEEYNELRNTVSDTIDYFESQEELRAPLSLKPQIKEPGTLRRILNYKIPLHKVAAIIVIVLAAEAVLDNSNHDSENGLTEFIPADTTMADNAFIRDIEEMKKYGSHNSIKYNTGLGRVH